MGTKKQHSLQWSAKLKYTEKSKGNQRLVFVEKVNITEIQWCFYYFLLNTGYFSRELLED